MGWVGRIVAVPAPTPLLSPQTPPGRRGPCPARPEPAHPLVAAGRERVHRCRRLRPHHRRRPRSATTHGPATCPRARACTTRTSPCPSATEPRAPRRATVRGSGAGCSCSAHRGGQSTSAGRATRPVRRRSRALPGRGEQQACASGGSTGGQAVNISRGTSSSTGSGSSSSPASGSSRPSSSSLPAGVTSRRIPSTARDAQRPRGPAGPGGPTRPRPPPGLAPRAWRRTPAAGAGPRRARSGRGSAPTAATARRGPGGGPPRPRRPARPPQRRG